MYLRLSIARFCRSSTPHSPHKRKISKMMIKAHEYAMKHHFDKYNQMRTDAVSRLKAKKHIAKSTKWNDLLLFYF